MNDSAPEGERRQVEEPLQDLSRLDEDQTLARIHLLIKTTRGQKGTRPIYPLELGELIKRRAAQLSESTGVTVSAWKVGDELKLSPAVVARLMKALGAHAMSNSKAKNGSNGTNGHAKAKAKTKPAPPQPAKPPAKPKSTAKVGYESPFVAYVSPTTTLSTAVARGIDLIADQLLLLGSLSDEQLSEVTNEQLSSMLQRAGTDLKMLLTTLSALRSSATSGTQTAAAAS